MDAPLVAGVIGGLIVFAHVVRMAVDVAHALRFEQLHDRSPQPGIREVAESTFDPEEFQKLKTHVATLHSWDMQATEDGLGYYGPLKTLELQR
ncbi:MAG: hypothetical protein ACOZNI_13045 [Myxococcota bacterium]